VLFIFFCSFACRFAIRLLLSFCCVSGESVSGVRRRSLPARLRRDGGGLIGLRGVVKRNPTTRNCSVVWTDPHETCLSTTTRQSTPESWLAPRSADRATGGWTDVLVRLRVYLKRKKTNSVSARCRSLGFLYLLYRFFCSSFFPPTTRRMGHGSNPLICFFLHCRSHDGSGIPVRVSKNGPVKKGLSDGVGRRETTYLCGSLAD